MRRQNVSAYTEVRAPRWGAEENSVTYAKRIPKYVHGARGNAALLHRVLRVRLRWWTCGPNGNYLVRLQSPRLLAECVCGMTFRISDTSAKVCESPKTDAVLCGRCHGRGRNFPRNHEHEVPMSLAKIRLGCVASSEVSA